MPTVPNSTSTTTTTTTTAASVSTTEVSRNAWSKFFCCIWCHGASVVASMNNGNQMDVRLTVTNGCLFYWLSNQTETFCFLSEGKQNTFQSNIGLKLRVVFSLARMQNQADFCSSYCLFCHCCRLQCTQTCSPDKILPSYLRGKHK